VKILCNLPLECFAPRASLSDVELVTYGPPGRMVVDGTLFPFDIEFDPSTGSVGELWRKLPVGFTPDVLLLWWPEQEPLPRDLHRCPARVVGVVSDYNLSLPALAGLWPFFDVLLADRGGVDLFARMSFADVRYFCQYTFKEHAHFVHAGLARDLDIGFAGNLNPAVQRARAPWIERVRALGARGHTVAVTSGVHGAAYGRLLSRSKIGFNRAIRGEINLRAFEIAACGACLFMERGNREVADFFVPGEECVLYGDDDFEALVAEHLADQCRRQRIAAAGHARVQGHRLRDRLGALQQVLAPSGPGRPRATDFDVHLGRGVALLPTWAGADRALAELTSAHRACPGDPRPPTALALALLKLDPSAHAARALQLLAGAAARAPRYLPALRALAWLHEVLALPTARWWREQLAQTAAATLEFGDVDGLPLPLGYGACAVDIAQALAGSVRQGTVQRALCDAWCTLDVVAAG
jgi:hypothetical protein